jgi:hypothetical protein
VRGTERGKLVKFGFKLKRTAEVGGTVNSVLHCRALAGPCVIAGLGKQCDILFGGILGVHLLSGVNYCSLKSDVSSDQTRSQNFCILVSKYVNIRG